MWSIPSCNDAFGISEDDIKAPLPSEITPEQAAAIRSFGDSILESLSVSERLRHEHAADLRRKQFRVVR